MGTGRESMLGITKPSEIREKKSKKYIGGARMGRGRWIGEGGRENAESGRRRKTRKEKREKG